MVKRTANVGMDFDERRPFGKSGLLSTKTMLELDSETQEFEGQRRFQLLPSKKKMDVRNCNPHIAAEVVYENSEIPVVTTCESDHRGKHTDSTIEFVPRLVNTIKVRRRRRPISLKPFVETMVAETTELLKRYRGDVPEKDSLASLDYETAMHRI